MRKLFLYLLVIGTMILCFTLLPCSVFAGQNDEVRVALPWDPATVNMFNMKTANELPVILHMHEALLTTMPVTGERIPNIGEPTVMKNKKDIKFKLEKGRVFHTGDMLTAHDVKFTYDQCMNPKNAMIMASALSEIEEVEVLDDYTFIIRFYEPYAAWKELMWIGICSKKYFENAGEEKFFKHPVGSGPFKFGERKVGEYVVLKAVENYVYQDRSWDIDKKTKKRRIKKTPSNVDFKTLKFLTVADEVSRVAMLETKELDLVYSIMPHYLKRLKNSEHIKIKRAKVPSLYGLSTKPDLFPVLKDIRLVRAINYAMNRQEIVDKIFLGEGYPLYKYASRSELGYDPNFKYEYNPAKAKKLVQESIYKPGTPLILSYTSAVPNASMVAAAVQQYLKEVGITVKMQQLEPGTQATYARKRDPREGHMTLYNWDGGRDPSSRLILSIISDSEYSAWSTRKNKDIIDKLVIQQARELNEKKRLALLKRIHDYLTEEPGGPVLFGLNQIYAISDRIDYTWTAGDNNPYHLQRIKIVN
jgi:peptide/nickel transport system substrate-binding protein